MSALYTSMSAARAQSQALDVTAHNIANASTPGFRAQRVSFQQAMGDVTPQVMPGRAGVDSGVGTIKATGNPLDLALPAEGYFALSGAGGDRYTRAGAFARSDDGYIVDPSGRALQGTDGESLQISPMALDISVGEDGVIHADGELIGQVRVVYINQQDLRSEGANFRVDGPANVADIESPKVASGALEGSNFKVVQGMLDLIRASRSYESAVRTMQTVSELEKRTARGFGSAG